MPQVETRENRARSEKKYRESHRAECRKRCQDWYGRNRESVAKRKRGYFSKLPPERQEKMRAANRRNAKKHPAGYRARSQKRKAIKIGVTVRPDKIQEWWAALCAKPSVACYYCGNNFPPSELHMEHVIPLARGGVHSVENLCAGCPNCNCSKGAKMPSEWWKPAQVFLNL